MPQWIALLAIVVVGWLVLSVVGGLVIGRGLRAFERHRPSAGRPQAKGEAETKDDLQRAA